MQPRSLPGVRAPDQIAVGPDGNLWFTNDDSGRIGRITPEGEITTFGDPSGKVRGSSGIASGPDGNVWFTAYAYDNHDVARHNLIGRITPTGAITTFNDPAGKVKAPDGIAVGPDGNLWFTNYDNDRIGRITPSGQITTFADPAGRISGPEGIAEGPDERLWFTSSDNGRIGWISTEGEIKTFRFPSVREPWIITVDQDRYIWFTDCDYDYAQQVCRHNRIDRMTTTGQIATFSDPGGNVREPDGIAVGADGDLWFASYENDRLGRITPTGKITTFPVRSRGCNGPLGITMGPDGNMWFTCNHNNRIGRITSAGEITSFPLR